MNHTHYNKLLFLFSGGGPGGSYGNSFGNGFGGYGGFGGNQNKFNPNDTNNKFKPGQTDQQINQFSGGNGGLPSYNGYGTNNYNGQRNLGFGYYRGTDSYGFLPSRETNFYSGTGYRGYN